MCGYALGAGLSQVTLGENGSGCHARICDSPLHQLVYSRLQIQAAQTAIQPVAREVFERSIAGDLSAKSSEPHDVNVQPMWIQSHTGNKVNVPNPPSPTSA